MSDPINEAIQSFERWSKAFNSRDIDGMLNEMHFPHYRLSCYNDIKVCHSSSEHRNTLDLDTQILREEDWHETTTSRLNAVQSGDNKVHLTFYQTRRNSDDVAYNSFETLWIFTRINAKWGARFRSSFLNNSQADANFINN
jgi:hypothetical protein